MSVQKKPIESGIIAQAVNGIRTLANSWFGPLDPLEPLVPAIEKPSVEGRSFDFPVGVNRNVTPRNTEAISFPQLRALADSCDVLRLVIETRKDQMAKLKWAIQPIDNQENKEKDPRCKQLMDFFKMPDKENDWDTWLRMLLEDMLVIDAPTVYVRKTLGNALYSFELIDGATIKRVIDVHGRTPIPPQTAFQQILKGIPAVNYTTDEIIYKPRNKRTHKVYGYSPVEQIVMTINTALRRSVHKLQAYTEGNIPEMIVGCPEDWPMDKVIKFQQYWDSILEGNTAQRRKARFVPSGLKIEKIREDVLKDEFDEWLARIVCFAFSIEPTPFIKSMNRATAETSRDAALSEGLAPVMQWTTNLINLIIWKYFGYTDLEFAFVDEKVQDPLQRAQVNQIYLQNGVISADEVRADLGLEGPAPEKEEPAPVIVAQPDNPQLQDQQTQQKPEDKNTATGKEAVAKRKKTVTTPISQNRKSLVKFRKRLASTVSEFLKEQIPIITEQISSKIGKISKADIADEIGINWDDLVPKVSVILGAVATDGSIEAMKAVSSDKSAEKQATQWALDRAAELVGKKWVDGNLVDNPDAKWVITDSTREMIRGLVADAIDEGYTTNELSDVLEDSFAFSEGRAQMIARTEVRMADVAGQVEGFKESGVVSGKIWSTADDEDVSEDCVDNALAGVISLEDDFPSGDEAPPSHPNCRCAILAELIPEDE